MKVLVIKETAFSPSVVLDSKQNKFEIKGSSRPENAVEFYTPVLNWLNELAVQIPNLTVNHPLNFHFSFDYLNSISIKILFDSFRTLEKINSQTKSINVVWHYKSGDTDMKETGEEYSKILNLPFAISPIH